MSKDNQVVLAIRKYWSMLFYGDRCWVQYRQPWNMYYKEKDAYYWVEEQEDGSCLYWGPNIEGLAPDKQVACSQLTAFIIDNLVAEGTLVETSIDDDQEEFWGEEDDVL